METREAVTQEAMEAQEEWRSIPGYEGLYEASNLGRIRSLDRADSRGNRIKGRTLKPATCKKGYRKAVLSRSGKAKTFLVHRLVLSAFVGPCPAGQESRHLNGVPGDNRLSNLAYGTSSENNRDRVTHGTHHQTRKSHCPAGHPHFEENNVPSEAKRGKRSCRICRRSRDYLRIRPDFPESMKWAVRDMYAERFLLES